MGQTPIMCAGPGSRQRISEYPNFRDAAAKFHTSGPTLSLMQDKGLVLVYWGPRGAPGINPVAGFVHVRFQVHSAAQTGRGRCPISRKLR